MPIKVIYVGGSGRSGTTILARILGQTTGYIAIGEVRELWRLGLMQNHPCGCGHPFRECPVWLRVGAEAFGGWERTDPEAALSLVQSFTYLDALDLVRGTSRNSRHLAFFRLLERLYEGIHAAANGATIVDTSKGTEYGVALAATPGLEVRAIHLIRDSRGVAYSWTKEVPRPYTLPRVFRMHRLDVLATARWMAHHTLMELLGRRIPMARLRYESLMDQPRSQLLGTLAAIGHPENRSALPFIDDHTVRLAVDHTVAGNPNRTSNGVIPLHLDAEWHQGLPMLQRIQVTAMTWPLLAWYGYRL